jgi:hypothetical protein
MGIWLAALGRAACGTELREYDFATYCAGEATRWGGELVAPHQANVQGET